MLALSLDPTDEDLSRAAVWRRVELVALFGVLLLRLAERRATRA